VGEHDRFCVHCGHPLQATAEDRPAAPTITADTTGIFQEYRSHRRPVLIGLAVVGALVAALGVLYLADWYFFRPAHTVEAYFDALAGRDSARALELLVPGDADQDQRLLDRAVLRSHAYAPPQGVRLESVESLEGDDNSVIAQVSFTLGGQRRTMALELRRDEHAVAGVFRRWRIAGGVYPVSVTAYGVDAIVAGGVNVPFAEGSDSVQLAALPGDYSVVLPDQPLLTAPEAHVYAGDEAGSAVAIEPTIRPGVEEEVDRQVRATIDECAAQTTLSPPDCPFQSYAFSEVRNVRWKITEYPVLRLGISQFQRGQVVVETAQSGQADVTGSVDDGFGGKYAYQDEVAISISGTVTASGGTITWHAEGQD
jgi:hypothetical protein